MKVNLLIARRLHCTTVVATVGEETVDSVQFDSHPTPGMAHMEAVLWAKEAGLKVKKITMLNPIEVLDFNHNMALEQLYRSALTEEGWNLGQTADRLGITRQRLTKVVQSERYPKLAREWEKRRLSRGRPCKGGR